MTIRKVPCEVYSRIVGYLRPLQNWNAAKLAEFADRRVYDVPSDHELRATGNTGQRPVANTHEDTGTVVR